MTNTLTFTYMNHRGEVRERKVGPPFSLEFIRFPGWDYQPGWFLAGQDLEKGERRSFSLSRIVLPAIHAQHIHIFPLSP